MHNVLLSHRPVQMYEVPNIEDHRHDENDKPEIFPPDVREHVKLTRPHPVLSSRLGQEIIKLSHSIEPTGFLAVATHMQLHCENQ